MLNILHKDLEAKEVILGWDCHQRSKLPNYPDWPRAEEFPWGHDFQC